MGRKSNDMYLEGTNSRALAVFIMFAAIVAAVIGILIVVNLVSPSDDPRNIEVINFTWDKPTPTPTVIHVNDTITTKDSMKIHFMNVGQADCALIEHNGKYAYIDIGKSTQGAYYTTLRAHKPDVTQWILASHQDSDHIGNMAYMMALTNVGTYYDNGITTNTQNYNELMDKIRSSNIKRVVMKEGDTINTWSDVKITAVAVNSSGGKDLNDDGIVIRLEYDGVIVGFAADVSEDVDAEVGEKLGDVDILKVAHHGAKTSSSAEFLSNVKPELSIISVGTNSYGHPSTEAIERLSAYGEVYRTDQNGCVEVVIENGAYKVVQCDRG